MKRIADIYEKIISIENLTRADEGTFEGKKISIEDLFNVAIVISAYKIEESKFAGKNRSSNRLELSLSKDGQKYITFTGSDTLMDMIKKVPESEFPFETILRKHEKRYEFT